LLLLGLRERADGSCDPLPGAGRGCSGIAKRGFPVGPPPPAPPRLADLGPPVTPGSADPGVSRPACRRGTRRRETMRSLLLD